MRVEEQPVFLLQAAMVASLILIVTFIVILATVIPAVTFYFYNNQLKLNRESGKETRRVLLFIISFVKGAWIAMMLIVMILLLLQLWNPNFM